MITKISGNNQISQINQKQLYKNLKNAKNNNSYEQNNTKNQLDFNVDMVSALKTQRVSFGSKPSILQKYLNSDLKDSSVHEEIVSRILNTDSKRLSSEMKYIEQAQSRYKDEKDSYPKALLNFCSYLIENKTKPQGSGIHSDVLEYLTIRTYGMDDEFMLEIEKEDKDEQGELWNHSEDEYSDLQMSLEGSGGLFGENDSNTPPILDDEKPKELNLSKEKIVENCKKVLLEDKVAPVVGYEALSLLMSSTDREEYFDALSEVYEETDQKGLKHSILMNEEISNNDDSMALKADFITSLGDTDEDHGYADDIVRTFVKAEDAFTTFIYSEATIENSEKLLKAVKGFRERHPKEKHDFFTETRELLEDNISHLKSTYKNRLQKIFTETDYSIKNKLNPKTHSKNDKTVEAIKLIAENDEFMMKAVDWLDQAKRYDVLADLARKSKNQNTKKYATELLKLAPGSISLQYVDVTGFESSNPLADLVFGEPEGGRNN